MATSVATTIEPAGRDTRNTRSAGLSASREIFCRERKGSLGSLPYFGSYDTTDRRRYATPPLRENSMINAAPTNDTSSADSSGRPRLVK